MEAFSKAISVILLTVMLFIGPAVYSAQKTDAVIQDYVTTVTDRFVETVRSQGMVSQENYNNFLAILDNTGLMYTIELQCIYNTTVPVMNGTKVTGINTYETIDYTDQILEFIYNDTDSHGCYKMKKGDYFYCKVTNREKTTFTKMAQAFIGHAVGKEQICSFAGGSIRDENY